VALVSLASRRWGLKIGGAIGGFPVVVGPTLFFFALEQGPDFTAQAALRALLAIPPFGVFCMAMSWLSLRLRLSAALVLAWAAFLLAGWLILQWQAELLPAGLAAVASASLVPLALPKAGARGALAAPSLSLWDLPIRMLATVLLILSVTGLAKTLGPAWSGLLAAFPIASSILAGFARLSDGPGGPAALLRGTLIGNFSFGAFCVALVYGLPRYGIAASFLAALFIAVAVQIAALSLSRAKG
jgi:uncharacterized membrane protein (GlpM family)